MLRVGAFACMCVYALCERLAHGGQKRVLACLEPELEAVWSRPVSTRNGT